MAQPAVNNMFRARREMTFRDVMAAIGRNRKPAIIIMLVSILLGAVLYKLTPATYRSSEELLLQPSVDTPTTGDPVLGPISSPSTTIDVPTQIQVLQSSKLMGDIYARSGIGVFDENAPDIPIVKVELLKDTYAMQVFIDCSNPETAKLVATNLPKVYEDFLHVTRQGEIDKELQFLSTQRNEDYNENIAAIDAYNKFELGRTGVKPGSGELQFRTDRVQVTQNQLDKANEDVAANEQRTESLKAQLKALPPLEEVPNTRVDDSQIELQKQRIVDLQAQREALLRTYQPTSRKVQEIDAEISEQETRLAKIPKTTNTTAKVKNSKIVPLEEEIAGQEAGQRALAAERAQVQGNLAKAQSDLNAYMKLEPTEQQLLQNISRTRLKLDSTDATISNLKLRQSSVVEPVTLLSSATDAVKIKPVALQYLGVAVLLGLFLGIGFALGRDALRDTVSTFSDVEDLALGERVVYLPSLPAVKGDGGNALLPADAPSLDTYRILRFALFEPELQDAKGSVLVTSSGRRDGKTMLACNLAEVLAASGKKVVLVDANHRHASLAPIYEVADAPGLGDMLAGSVPLAAALEPTAVENLLVVAAGLWPAGGGGLLDSGRMQSVHEQLKAVADVVIFDAPNCLESADVIALATICDSVVFAAEIGTTRRPQMTRGLELIRRSRARFLGVVLRDHSDNKSREKVTA
jgi:capsular exopolysaccharide synthesis family protein